MDKRTKELYFLITLIIGGVSGILCAMLETLIPLAIVAGLSFFVFLCHFPYIGLCGFVIAIPLLPFKAVAVYFGVVSVASFIYLSFSKNKPSFIFPLKYSLGLFTLALIFSTVTSYARGSSIMKLVAFLMAITFFYLSTNLIDTKRKLYIVILCVILISSFVGLYGLYQYRVGIELKDSWIDREINPDMRTRVISTFDNPNVLAEYLVLSIPISMALLFSTTSWLKRISFSIAILVQGLALLLTFSRGGWIGFAVAMVIFAVLIDRRLLGLYLIGFLGLMAVSPSVVLTRISSIGSTQDSSNAYRIPLWKATIEMIRDYWLNGVGLGMDAYKSVYINYMREGVVAVHSHNSFLQIFAETGIFGFLGFVAFVINSLKCNLVLFFRGKAKLLIKVAVACGASVVGVLIHGLVDNVFYSDRIIMTFWIVISIGYTSFLVDKRVNGELK